MAKDRVEIFSDAIFAIIMTLLVLELHVPEIADHSTFSQYVVAMTPLMPKFVSFILSFVVIAIHWVAHHYFFLHLRNTPIGLIWLNNFFLLWLCFLPFPTAMLGDHPTDQFPIVLYGANSLLLALTFFSLRSYAVNNKLFTVDIASAGELGPRHSIPAMTLFFLSILFAFVNVYLSLFCFFLVPILYFVPNLVGSKAFK